MDDETTIQLECIQATPTSLELSEEEVLAAWDDTIERVAQAMARTYRLGDEMAKDLAQQARLRVVASVRQGRPLAPAYVHSVVRNTIRTAVKRERLRQQLLDPLPDDSDCSTPSQFQTLPKEFDPFSERAVRRWLPTLPQNLQAVYRLLYEEGYSQEEAARRMRVSQPRVAQLHRELLRRAGVQFSDRS